MCTHEAHLHVLDVQLLASCEKLLRVCYVLQSYCTVSTNRSTLGSTNRSTEEVPVSTEKVRTLFFGAYRMYITRPVIYHKEGQTSAPKLWL